GHHPRRVEREQVALAARVVADDDAPLASARVGGEQVRREPGGRLANRESVHAQRAGADGGAQPGGTEVQATGEAGGQLVGWTVDQGGELRADVVIWLGVEPPLGPLTNGRVG